MARPATAAVRLLTGEREPVRLATTTNITLYGLQTIDGVQVDVGDRVLVKDQADQTGNGIYTASEGQWFRAADARTARTLQKGTTVTVQEGTVNADKEIMFTALDPQIGDDPILVEERLLGSVRAVIRDYIDVAPYIATRTALRALDTTKDTVAYLKEAGRQGVFVWTAGDFSTQIAADTQEGIYVKATTIASNLGAWVRQFSGPASPLWFGCTMDGTDSATAFGKFIDALVAFGLQGELPSGTITLASKITRNIGPAALVLGGQGEDVSVLLWTGADGGLDITSTHVAGQTQWSRQVELHHFSLKTSQVTGGTALAHTISPVSASSASILSDFHDLSVQGLDVNADYWNNGIVITDGWNSFVERCNIKGMDDDGLSPFLAADGIRLVRCNDCHVTGNHIYHVTRGIVGTSDLVSYGDGHFISDNRVIGVDKGIVGFSNSANEWFGVDNNHINAYVRGIELTNIVYTPFTGNTIFKTNSSTQADWPAILMQNGNSNVVSGNNIATPGAPGGVGNFGVFVSGGGDNIVHDNCFTNTTGTFYGVYLATGTLRNDIAGNHGDASVDVMVSGSGTEGAPNYIRDNHPVTSYTTFASLDTTPSVGNAISGIAVTANAGATSITTLDDGFEGQEVEVRVGDANTTFVHSAALVLLGAQNTLAPNGAILCFRRVAVAWIETGRSYAVGNLIVGTYAQTPKSPIHAYAAANSLQIALTVENDNAGAGAAAIGLSVTGTAAAETRSRKAGFALTRTAANGRGTLGVYNRSANDTSDFVASDMVGGWNLAGIFHSFKGADVASAAAIVPTGNLFHVTGTTGITSIDATGLRAGTTIRMVFDGILTVTAGSNLKMAGNFTTSASDMLVMTWDGTNWYEEGRSANA